MTSPVARLADTIDGLVAASVRLEEALGRGAPELTVHRLRRALVGEAAAAKHVADGTRAEVARAVSAALKCQSGLFQPANDHSEPPIQPSPNIA